MAFPKTLCRSALTVLAFVTFAACERTPQQATAPTGPQFSRTAPAEQDPLLARVLQINQQLAASGQHVAIEALDFFTVGNGRPGVRLHQTPFRWVPNDPRRLADGTNITYIFDQSGGHTASGLTAAQTEAAVDAALATWSSDDALKKVALVKRPDPGTDITIFDAFFGFGGFGDPFAADIVDAGFYPRAFFEAVGGPGGGRGILAFSVSFIFVDDNGNPTDINGDNYLDTALNEVYYNNTFGDPASDRAGNPWRINQPLPAIDVQTVALHENGHSLELGHFGPPPDAVMNPVYAGIRHAPLPTDDAGMNAVWQSWPNP
ncbi:MAG: hypothetical protein DMD54_04180 [Gemmatimonadetes bacterium]|nr:MAG: hypothetical protein DMD54_04180 [Gemmatimonadota bacterium]